MYCKCTFFTIDLLKRSATLQFLAVQADVCRRLHSPSFPCPNQPCMNQGTKIICYTFHIKHLTKNLAIEPGILTKQTSLQRRANGSHNSLARLDLINTGWNDRTIFVLVVWGLIGPRVWACLHIWFGSRVRAWSRLLLILGRRFPNRKHRLIPRFQTFPLDMGCIGIVIIDDVVIF